MTLHADGKKRFCKMGFCIENVQLDFKKVLVIPTNSTKNVVNTNQLHPCQLIPSMLQCHFKRHEKFITTSST